MKKIISIIMIAALLPFAGASAQEQEEKQYLPEAGDWALGIDVVPVLRYIGNAFNGNTNNQYIDNLGGEPFVNQNKRFNSRQLMPDVSIQGKYMITDEWGVRANVGLMFRSIYDNRYATDDKAAALNPLSNDKVVDKARYRKNGMSIMAGGEYRKGTKRVQGVFGMGVLFAFQNDNTTYTYGNEMTDINQQPTTAFQTSDVYDNNNYRLTKTNGEGSDFYVGITGSAGIEWFVAPKISIGGEVNISAVWNWTKATYYTAEGFNTLSGAVEEWTELEKPSSHGFSVGTGNIGSNLSVTFYF